MEDFDCGDAHYRETERERLHDQFKSWVVERFPDGIHEVIMERKLVQFEFLRANDLPLDTVF